MTNSLNISLFPSVSKSDLKKYGIGVPKFQASYLDINGSMRPLKIEEADERFYTIEDEGNEWDVEKYGIQLIVSNTISSPAKLFGPAGIADVEAIIGIAVMILSKDSSRRIVRKANPEYDLTSTSDGRQVDISIELPSGDFTGSAHVRTVLYLKKASSKGTGFADRAGFIIGDIDHALIILKGEGSEFPITVGESENNYLWKLKTYYEDPKTDSFRNNVELFINQKHPLYSSLGLDGGKRNSIAIFEIMSQATQILIEQVIIEVGADELASGTGIEIDSVAMAVQNMISTFAKSYGRPAELSVEIHNQIVKGEL